MAYVDIETALQHHQAGRLAEAESQYRQILARRPNDVAALHLLGVVADQVGRHEVAVDLIRRAVAIEPRIPEAHSNLGNALSSLGQIDEAIKSYQRALVLKPDFADAHNNLGNAFGAKGEFDKAIACYQRSLLLRPESADAHHNLGVALQGKCELDQAIASYQRAIVLRPDFADAFFSLGCGLDAKGEISKAIAMFQRTVVLQPDHAEANMRLGNALAAQARFHEAIACYRRVVQLKPEMAEACNNLGAALQAAGQADQAIAQYQKAVALKPDYAEAHSNLGKALHEKGRVDEVIASCRRALELKPDYAAAHYNLGNALKDVGRLDEAVACYQRATEIAPDFVEAHSNWICLLPFLPDSSVSTVRAQTRIWDQRHAQPLEKSIKPHDNDRSPDRKLKIGYVSADFCRHACAFFIDPLLRCHDHDQFEIICYAQVKSPDSLTERFKSYADRWHDTVGLSDELMADQIRQDGIDILVDLKMHTLGNRLLVFARKPAPVQASWLNPGSSGLAAIDYRFTDPYQSVAGEYERSHEQTIQLPDTYWCYDPLGDEATVNELPATKNGFITFGCLNNFSKINERVLEVWAAAMVAVRDSRLLLMAPSGECRQWVLDVLQRHGVANERIEFADRGTRLQYLQFYHRIDLGLDCFPYNGHTTSLDSFWMGVPVVTLIGSTPVGRVGWSQLCNLDLKELASDTPAGFVQIAGELAGNLLTLSQLRKTLRQRMQQSPLMDAPRFDRNIEAAYRKMWRAWCESV